MADPAPAEPALDSGAATSLAALAFSITDGLPALLERSLRHDVENSILSDQCAELRGRTEHLQADIALERSKQAALRAQIFRVRAPAGVQKSSSTKELRTALVPRNTDADSVGDKENIVDVSLISEGSPISLRSKRKGRIFPDDMRIVKRMKLDDSSK
ncbi:uncharacterized protein PHACADRAFT_198832 [Phanerochaete carnosa HHB-10118-sp]|uniref:Uncharacterized protein n=1 Tax=Phanerochaete carnosa (strain HHB-10118-sp) TaxID=650164 RepID=K5VMV4_PHACS|nr:uncharacterized protein PHACADRAFT_198832 [Phanerochaete carnosa HHB-10118-sp]EKM52783.1 hypothetical protein PHACADRAFT_198832 [Phanerochaete carnosa HHB-10118-sp]